MVQVTGLEPTRLMRSLAPEASALCLRNKFRYHQIKDLVQFRHCCFKVNLFIALAFGDNGITIT